MVQRTFNDLRVSAPEKVIKKIKAQKEKKKESKREEPKLEIDIPQITNIAADDTEIDPELLNQILSRGHIFVPPPVYVKIIFFILYRLLSGILRLQIISMKYPKKI